MTLPQMLAAHARRLGRTRVALREKQYGIWQEVTWEDYAAHVRHVCLGLEVLGLRRADTIAIVCGNRPAWLYTELGAQALGAIPVGAYVDSLSDQLRCVVEESEARIVVVEDQEQTDKILAVRADLPRLARIVVSDPRGLEDYREPLLISLDEVERLGRDAGSRDEQHYDALLELGTPDDIALLAYTSGTTGPPKASMISHRNLLAMATGVTQVDRVYDTDDVVSFLPFSWIGEQLLSVAIAIHAGATVNFPEEPVTVRDDLREIGPQLMIAPPRFWETMCSEYQVKIADAGWLKGAAARWALAIGMRAAERRLERRPIGPGLSLLARLAHLLVFRALLDRLGLSRARFAYTAGASLGPELFRFFRAIGLNLKQVYGQTESGAIAVLHVDGDVRPETVGKPTPGTRLRISEAGEILLAGSAVFRGYYKNPEATARALDDGWLRTGDAGCVDEHGHLMVIDRLSDVLRLADGSRFSATLIENKLKFSPYVREAVVVGEDRPFVVVLIQIDMRTVGSWAEARRVPFTTFKDLSGKLEVVALIEREVARVNDDLPSAARIHAFTLFDKELDADDDELTRTNKVRRPIILSKYRDTIEGLYVNQAPPTEAAR
jgi:long-chain acyl-CoA synthetase